MGDGRCQTGAGSESIASYVSAPGLQPRTRRYSESDDILRSGESTGYASGEQGAEAERSGPSGRTEPLSPEELLEHLQKLRPEDFGRFTP